MDTKRTHHSECALYAPALDQTVQDIIDCLYDAHVDWGDVWCTGGTNSTATGKYEDCYSHPYNQVKVDAYLYFDKGGGRRRQRRLDLKMMIQMELWP